MSDSVANLKKQLTELQEFVKTSAWRSYVATFKVDITECELNIINTIPTDDATLAHLLQLHGQRAELLRSLTFFETSQTALEEQIAAAEDAETNESDNKNEEETTND